MTTQDADTYQGWANRETWALNLWLSNDEGLYDMARELVADAVSCGQGEPWQVARALKAWVEDDLVPMLAETEQGRVMLGEVGSLWRVNFGEVAASFLED